MRLAALTDGLPVDLRVAELPDDVPVALARTAAELVVADTGPLGSGADLAGLLRAFKPDETHLVLPASSTAVEAAALLEAASELRVNRVLIAGDEAPGGPVGAALAARKPISYVLRSCRLSPADPAALAARVLA
jgi:hypothetical protein